MSEEKFYEDGNFWIGVGSYYLISWIFTFYPAFVVGWYAGLKLEEGTDDDVVVGLISMLVSFIILVLLKAFRQYFILVVIYLVFLFPFIVLLKQYWDLVE